MGQLPFHIQKAIRKGEPIDAEGLRLYPVRVAEYEEFQASLPALEVLQQSFPVALISVPILSAFFAMEQQAAASGVPGPGLFQRALLGLALSLRLGEGQTMAERVGLFRYQADPTDRGRLLRVCFASTDGTEHTVTPVQYQRLRPILAAQNGVELPSPDANPELVQAERVLAEKHGAALTGDVEELVSAVASLGGADEEEIYRWPILRLNRRSESIRRMLGYLVCGFGETQGASWKGGNPCPDPFFRKKSKESAHVALADFAGGAGQRAVESAGKI